MKELIDTGRTKNVKIKKAIYFCDKCKKALNKGNPKTVYSSIDGTKHVCKYNKECNPFYVTPQLQRR